MTRLLPHPTMSAALAVAWIALTEATPAHIALALVLALGLPHLLRAFLEGFPRGRRPLRALQLLLHVVVDVITANVTVSLLVLGPMRRLRPVFFEVPLEVENPHAVTFLATIVTMTPGTVSSALSPDARSLHVHALSADDPDALTARIKRRYERALLEIFEC